MEKKSSQNSGWKINLKRARNTGQIGQAGNNLTQNQYNNTYYNQKVANRRRFSKTLLLFAASEIIMVISFYIGSILLVKASLYSRILMPISGMIVGFIPILGEFGVLVFIGMALVYYSEPPGDSLIFIGLSLALAVGVRIRRSWLS